MKVFKFVPCEALSHFCRTKNIVNAIKNMHHALKILIPKDDYIIRKNELKDQNNLVIVQYKHMNKDFKNLNYKVIDKGRKYMLIEKR